jgi:N-acetylglucosamine kinase-like BadF-type ATPase
VAAVCGTGTGFCAVNPAQGLSARASGQEYLLSDEGGGFDIGLRGLRAVVRAADGRGPATALSAALAAWRDVTPATLRGLIHGSEEPKVLVASFATSVLLAADQGDPAARAIVAQAVDELLAGVQAVARRAQLSDAFEIVLSGSNLTAAPALQAGLRRALDEVLPRTRVLAIGGSPLDAVARMAAILPGEPRFLNLLMRTLPFARLGQHDRTGATFA